MTYYPKKNVATDDDPMAVTCPKIPAVRDNFRDMVFVLDRGGVLDEDLRSWGRVTGYLRKWNEDNINGARRRPSNPHLEEEGSPPEYEPLIRALNDREALWMSNTQVGLRILDDILELPRETTIDGKTVPLVTNTRYELIGHPNWNLIEQDRGAWAELVLAVWTAEMWPYFLEQDIGKGRRERVPYRPREARRIITVGR